MTARDQQILARHNAGELHTTIAADFGITKERVRQIVKAGGGTARRVTQRAKGEEIAATIAAEGLTARHAAKRFGRSQRVIWYVARKHGIKFPRPDHDVEMRLAALSERVLAGESIRSVCNGDRNLSQRLERYCRARGIKSKVGRWKDFSHRADLVRQWRADGLTWRECAGRLSSIEGHAIHGAAVYVWIAKHHPDILDIRASKAPKPAKVRKPRPPWVPRPRHVAPAPDIEIKETVRDTAIANRGRASASQIAQAIGVSRNSIIGHWRRARDAGVFA